MLDEVLDYLNLKQGGVYVDATAGGGGHSRAIAQRIGSAGVVIAIDRDSQALVEASATVSGTAARFITCHAAFDNIQEVVISARLPRCRRCVVRSRGLVSPVGRQ